MSVGDVRPTAPVYPGRRALLSWCLYDWASNSFNTVVVTFVFSAYFTREVAADPAAGTAQWGYALAVAGLIVALTAPLAGAVADRRGRRKPWIFAMTAAVVCASFLLWFVEPRPDHVLLALTLIVVAEVAFGLAHVFYDSMLPSLAPRSLIGRLSGWAWGMGYAGGLFCLLAALALFVLIEPARLGLDPATMEPVRATAFLVALWYTVFAVPLFLFTPDMLARQVGFGQAIHEGIRQLGRTLGQARRYAIIVRFLFARLFYIEGLNTMFIFGGVYAAGTFGMGFQDILLFGIALNVTAGFGAAIFGFLDDRIGARNTILLALAGLLVLGTPLLFVEQVSLFWLFAIPFGLFMGPVQASSRSLMARLTPAGQEGEMFGLYALSGKITAFIGPVLVASLTALADSQRVGMSAIFALFVVGALLLLRVREPAAVRGTHGIRNELGKEGSL